MLKKTTIILSLALIILISACHEKADLTNLSETIYISNEGADMPAYIHGNASEKVFILVLHGGPGGNGLEYRMGLSSEELEKKYALVYWDQRGQGHAQGHYFFEDVTIDKMADDLNFLVMALKQKFGSDIKIFLLGHSWGGMLGTAYLLKDDYQHNITAWIDADGAHDIPLLNKEAIKLFRQVANEQINLGNSIEAWQEIYDWANAVDTNNITIEIGGEINSNGHQVEGYLKKDEVLTQGEYGDPIRDMLIAYQTNIFTSSIAGGITSAILYEEIENTAKTNQLEKITIPCLFLWGKYDFVVPPQVGVIAFNKVSSTEKEFVLLETSGHSPMVNQPYIFNEAIIDFVEKYK